MYHFTVDNLTVIQCAGIVLSGLGGILATFTDTRSHNKKWFTAFGWWAMFMIACGISLGAIGQIIANREAKKDNESALTMATNTLSKLETQSTTASNSLDTVRDISTSFNKVHMECELEMPHSDVRVAALEQDFHDWVIKTSQLPSGPPAIQGVSPIFQGTNTIVYVNLAAWNQPDLNKTWPHFDELESAWKAFPLVTAFVWVNRNIKSIDDVVTNSPRSSDLYLLNASFGPNAQCTLIYYESERKIYIRPTVFDCNTENTEMWHRNHNIMGFHHLANAQLVVGFNWGSAFGFPTSDPVLSKLRLDLITIHADDVNIFLSNVRSPAKNIKSRYNWASIPDVIWESQFPNETNIFVGNATPPIRMWNPNYH